MIIKITGSFLLIAQCGGYCSSHCIYILNSNKKGKEKGTLPSFYDIMWNLTPQFHLFSFDKT